MNYQGPDSSTAVVSGTCTDNAGNGALASRLLKYDDTAPTANGVPSRPADANGWYNHSLTVGFGGSDATSGIASCTASSVYAGPDAAAVSRSGTCTDRAGNPSASTTFPFKYDATPPQIGPGPRQAAGPGRVVQPAGRVRRAGNRRHVRHRLLPAAELHRAGQRGGVLRRYMRRQGRQSGTKSFILSYDATGPATTATADRSPDSSGWFNHPLTVSFSGTDAVSGTDSCSGAENYAGPDSVEAVVGGVCVDKAGNVGLASLSVSYDATAPVVTGAEPERRPDANGWYNHRSSSASGAATPRPGSRAARRRPTRGLIRRARASPAPASTTRGMPAHRCRSGSGSMRLHRQSASPREAGQRPRRSAGRPRRTRRWSRSAAARSASTAGAATFTDTGLKNGIAYRYTLTSYDEAANSSTSAAAARPSGPLVSPVSGAVVTTPPRLAWKPVAGATYYHVQLWRQGRILSAWPRGTAFQLRRTWIYNGRRYRLTRALPLVRLARTWPARAEELRPTDRLELVPRPLARSQNPRRQGQEDHVGEHENEEREPAQEEHRVRRGRLLA